MKTAVFYENIHDGAVATGVAVHDALQRLRDEGMEMLYISVDSWIRDRKELTKSLELLDLPIEGMHGFCDFAREPATLRYREMIDLAAEAGAGNLLFVPGMLSTENTRTALETMVAGMKAAVEYGKQKNLPILMEDFDGLLAPYNCIAGLQYFFEYVPGLECAYDTGNFAIFQEDELQAFDRFADKIRTVHLKDRTRERRHEGDNPCGCADGSCVYTCAVGSGYIQMDAIIKKLKSQDYKGNVIIELYSCDPRYVLQDAVESLKWVKERMGKEQ